MDKKDRLTLGTNINLSKLSLSGRTVRQDLSAGRSKNVKVEFRKRPKHDDLIGETALTDDEIDVRVNALKGSIQKQQELAKGRIEKERLEKDRLEQESRLTEKQKLEQETLSKEKAPTKEKAPDDVVFTDEKIETSESSASESSKPTRDILVKKHPKEGEDDKKSKKFVDMQKRFVKKVQLDADDEERGHRTKFKRRKKQFEKQKEPLKPIVRDVIIPNSITVSDLASRMAVRTSDIIKYLFKQGIITTSNKFIDGDTAYLICEEFGHRAKRVTGDEDEQLLAVFQDTPDQMVTRPPVVTVMGHVDHGKTSLLDAIRQTDVVSSEAGGITQHIGAYKITTKSGQEIVFIDTPGHAAFSQLRSRGANITDIVVLIVAADDGIKEQTVEAIRHAKSANVPIIVAINKMDKPGANPQQVYNELLQYEIVPESLGGDTVIVEVSAKTKKNLDKLEEAILVQAEVLELKATEHRPAEGTVIEASVQRGIGPVASVLLSKGTLNIGDVILAGSEFGKAKAIIDDHGKRLKHAKFGTPVQVLGFGGVPKAGDTFVVASDEKIASQIAEHRRNKLREEKHIVTGGPRSLENIIQESKDSQKKTLAVVVKGDAHGSVEAIAKSMKDIASDEVGINIMHSAIGAVNESDVLLAKASKALIIAFNVRPSTQAKELAKRESVEISYHSIIYNVIDEVQAIVKGLVGPIIKDKFIGYAEIRQVFNVTKVGAVAGCMVTEGVVQRGAKVRLLRDNVVVHEGDLKTLKRFKDEVKEVRQGFECGMAFENYNDIKVGDMVECYIQEEIFG